MSSKFSSISIEAWRQYKSVHIDFHKRLTVITGPNGTGKSTILSVLSRHFGYQRQYLSTPRKNRKTGLMSFSTGLFDWFSRKKDRETKNQRETIGYVEYEGQKRAEITVPPGTAIQYGIELPRQQSINGIHIDSHRPPSVYRQVPHISTVPMSKASIATLLNGELQHFYNHGQASQGTLFHIKSALISMSMFGEGNSIMEPNQELLNLFRGFEEKLRIILPATLGFEKLIIRVPEVVLKTRSGEFVIDAASGGIIKLIEIAWQIYFYSQEFDEFVVTMDEPENHLHPSMQREFLGNLLKAFPSAQFVVVTHSPFVVSSVKDSNVHVLSYEQLSGIEELSGDDGQSARIDDGARVVSEKLDTVNKAGTAAEILRDALGVPTTIPGWAEERTKEIIREYRKGSVSDESLDGLAKQLEEEGLISHFPEALNELTRKL